MGKGAEATVGTGSCFLVGGGGGLDIKLSFIASRSKQSPLNMVFYGCNVTVMMGRDSGHISCRCSRSACWPGWAECSFCEVPPSYWSPTFRPDTSSRPGVRLRHTPPYNRMDTHTRAHPHMQSCTHRHVTHIYYRQTPHTHVNKHLLVCLHVKSTCRENEKREIG